MRSTVFSRVILAVALVGGPVLFSSPTAQAQTGPVTSNSGAPTGPSTGPGLVPGFANPKMLSPDGLADYLRKQNYTVKQGRTPDGRPLLQVQIERNGWRYSVDIEYQADLKSFYMLARLGKVSGPTTELLRANQRIAPNYFSIWPDDQLCLEGYYNAQIDTALFQLCLDRFLGQIQQTHPSWAPAVALAMGK